MAIITNFVASDDFGIVLTTSSPATIKDFLLEQFKLCRLEVPNSDLLFVKLDEYVDEGDRLKIKNININLVKVFYNGERVVLSTITKCLNIGIAKIYRSVDGKDFKYYYNATDENREEIYKMDTRTLVDNPLVRFVIV